MASPAATISTQPPSSSVPISTFSEIIFIGVLCRNDATRVITNTEDKAVEIFAFQNNCIFRIIHIKPVYLKLFNCLLPVVLDKVSELVLPEQAYNHVCTCIDAYDNMPCIPLIVNNLYTYIDYYFIFFICLYIHVNILL